MTKSQRCTNRKDTDLVLLGPYGCRKTHLAASVARHRVEVGDTVLVQTVPDLLDHLRSAFSPQEDACQVRKGSAPHTLAILNSFLLALFDFLGVTNVSGQMRTFDAHPQCAVDLFLGALPKLK